MTLTRIPLIVSLSLTLLIMSDKQQQQQHRTRKKYERTDSLWVVCVCLCLVRRWMRPMAFSCWRSHRMCVRVLGIHALRFVIRIYLSCIFPLRQPFEQIVNVVKLLCQNSTNTDAICWQTNMNRVTDCRRNVACCRIWIQTAKEINNRM